VFSAPRVVALRNQAVSGSLGGKRESVLNAALRQFDLEAILALRAGCLKRGFGCRTKRGSVGCASEKRRFRLV
jgi:hypothetical protein